MLPSVSIPTYGNMFLLNSAAVNQFLVRRTEICKVNFKAFPGVKHLSNKIPFYSPLLFPVYLL